MDVNIFKTRQRTYLYTELLKSLTHAHVIVFECNGTAPATEPIVTSILDDNCTIGDNLVICLVEIRQGITLKVHHCDK